MSIERENVRYFVKPPVSGWHEVSKEGFERYVQFLKGNASPTIPMEQLIRLRTRIETNTPGQGGKSPAGIPTTHGETHITAQRGGNTHG